MKETLEKIVGYLMEYEEMDGEKLEEIVNQ